MPARVPAITLAATLAATLAILALGATAASAQDPAAFYKGRNINMEIGYSIGGGYDVYGRLVARHLGKQVPGNPTATAKNMEGAGSLRLTNWLYNVAPKDGTEMGTIGRGIAFDPLLGGRGAQFDASKFTWIGSANNEVSICVSWHTTGITKFEDLYTRSMTVGGTGGGSDTDVFPQFLNAVLGTKMNVISGYPGGSDVIKAMERGEVQGRCGWSWSSVLATQKDWVDQKKINILAQLSLTKHPDLPNVPLVTDFAKNDEQRQILRLIFARQVMGRPFLAPPGIPADRAEALRSAFAHTMADKDFLADAKKSDLEITPVSGAAVEQLVREVYATPKDIVAKAAQMLNPK
jgi:tripartite-type tricarboxylate transporter receptor subunit TctC